MKPFSLSLVLLLFITTSSLFAQQNSKYDSHKVFDPTFLSNQGLLTKAEADNRDNPTGRIL